ncbi:phosphotransferase enzyme family protein [Bacteroidota bacterium]
MEKNIKEDLSALFKKCTSQKLVNITEIPPSGSYRQYFRLHGENQSYIGVYNSDVKENIAFLNYSEHFFSLGLNVPELFTISEDKKTYLQEDLGGTGLFSIILQGREKGFDKNLIGIFKQVLSELPKFQIMGHKGLDYSVAYPREKFDRQSMLWDLNYFKYYFLKLARISFDEQGLEDDFYTLIDFLLEVPQDYFLFRDFQSSNIIIYKNKPYFIDYQGGRKGALQYDPASFLFDAKADFPAELKNSLLDYYISRLNEDFNIDTKDFKKYYYPYVLIRIMQAMGAFGFRGFYEKKPRFLESIPYALKNLQWLIDNVSITVEIPELLKALEKICKSKRLLEIA